MAKVALLAAAVALGGCSPRLTHEQIKTVADACHAAGMEYKVYSDQIICWTIDSPTPNKGESK